MKRIKLILITAIFSSIFTGSAFSEDFNIFSERENNFGRGFNARMKGKQGLLCDSRKFGDMPECKKSSSVILNKMPTLSEKLKELKETSPSVVYQFMRYLRKNNPLHNLRGLKKHSPNQKTKELTEKFLLSELNTFKLVDKYYQASEEEKILIKKEIRTSLNESFEIKQEIQKEVIDSLQKKIATMKNNTEKRNASKNEIIDNRLDVIVKKDDILKW